MYYEPAKASANDNRCRFKNFTHHSPENILKFPKYLNLYKDRRSVYEQIKEMDF